MRTGLRSDSPAVMVVAAQPVLERDRTVQLPPVPPQRARGQARAVPAGQAHFEHTPPFEVERQLHAREVGEPLVPRPDQFGRASGRAALGHRHQMRGDLASRHRTHQHRGHDHGPALHPRQQLAHELVELPGPDDRVGH